MIDIEGLREAVSKAFSDAYGDSRQIQDTLKKIEDGLSNYAGITDYSGQTGRILSNVLLDAISDECLENGYLLKDVANGVVEPAIIQAYDEVSRAAAQVQANINQGAGISFNAIPGSIDRSRVTNLTEKLTGDVFEKTEWLLENGVLGNITRSAISDTIRENARLHKEAGIHAYMVRYARAHCCKWCDSVSGVYEFGEQPDGFWKIHKHCTCIIEYKPSHYSQPDVISYVTGDDGKIRKVTEEMRQDARSSGIPESIRGNFDDFEPLSLTRSERRALNNIHDLSDKNNCEYGVFVSGDEASKPFTSNDMERVRIDLSQIAAGTSIFHSHTNDTPFSTQDFLFLLDERVEKIGVIAYNKDAFIASVGDGWRPSKEEFEKITNAIDSSVIDDLPDMPDFFEWTEEQKNYMRVREKAYRIAREFGWKLEGGNIDG